MKCPSQVQYTQLGLVQNSRCWIGMDENISCREKWARAFCKRKKAKCLSKPDGPMLREWSKRSEFAKMQSPSRRALWRSYKAMSWSKSCRSVQWNTSMKFQSLTVASARDSLSSRSCVKLIWGEGGSGGWYPVTTDIAECTMLRARGGGSSG